MMKMNHLVSLVFAGGLLVLTFMGIMGSLQFLTTQEVVLEWDADLFNSVSLPLLLVFDWMSLFFVSVVSIISASVFLYSSSYMATDLFYSRFIMLVLSFVLSMWILIFSPNFISILLGWDGLGVTSFLLVVYYQSEKSFNAGMITALTNRLGDVGLLIIIGCLFSCGSLSYLYMSFSHVNFSKVLMVLMVLAASTKSAQLPFSAWLPAAMAAPTPVSSLVHSSTLVTAGVYLLIRMNYLLGSLSSLWMLMMLGASTMLMAGISAMGEMDMKKIIALSTLSQLGLMFMTLGMGLPLLAFFHLAAHAYFKAMMFMCAGGIIHSMSEYQDTRVLGGSALALPMSVSIFFVGNLSLCGLPFMSGFFSKDLILELMMMSSVNMFLFLVAMLATFFTVAYSLRIMNMIFFSASRVEAWMNLGESGGLLTGSTLILLIPATVGGSWISWMVGTHSYTIFLPSWLKLIILFIISLALLMKMEMKSINFSYLSSFMFSMWFMPLMFSGSSTAKFLMLGKTVSKMGESGWNSVLGLKGFIWVNSLGGSYFNYSMTGGMLKSLWFILGVGLLII